MPTTTIPVKFEFEKTEVRIIRDHDGKPWWIMRDLCEVLEISASNAKRALIETPEWHKVVDVDVYSAGVSDNPTDSTFRARIVSEPGMYALIFRSRNKKAMQFQRFTFDTVLPSIREHGFYVAGAASDPTTQIVALSNLHNDLTRRMAEQLEEYRRECEAMKDYVQRTVEDAVKPVREKANRHMERLNIQRGKIADHLKRLDAQDEKLTEQQKSIDKCARKLKEKGDTLDTIEGQTGMFEQDSFQLKKRTAALDDRTTTLAARVAALEKALAQRDSRADWLSVQQYVAALDKKLSRAEMQKHGRNVARICREDNIEFDPADQHGGSARYPKHVLQGYFSHVFQETQH